MTLTRNRRIGVAVAIGWFALDQLLKAIVTGPLGMAVEGQTIQLLPIFDIAYTRNHGISLGQFPANSDAMRWLLVAVTSAIAVGVGAWMTRETRRLELVALGMVLGGALGNILDRVRLGYVVDFADLHFGNWHPFLVINWADCGVSIGVAVLLFGALLRDRATGAKAVAS